MKRAPKYPKKKKKIRTGGPLFKKWKNKKIPSDIIFLLFLYLCCSCRAANRSKKKSSSSLLVGVIKSLESSWSRNSSLSPSSSSFKIKVRRRRRNSRRMREFRCALKGSWRVVFPPPHPLAGDGDGKIQQQVNGPGGAEQPRMEPHRHCCHTIIRF